jgi:hypothetical protein
VPVLVALYTAVPRLLVWRGLLAWSGAAAISMMVGSALAAGAFGPDQVVSGLTSAGMALALGLYVGIRRRYLARLHERALFARALASFGVSGTLRRWEVARPARGTHRRGWSRPGPTAGCATRSTLPRS